MIIIVTGPIHSGKSEVLLDWAKGKPVCGFITPTRTDRKVFVDLSTGQYSAFEEPIQSDETITIGQYHLKKSAFEKAKGILRTSLADSPRKSHFLLDEIGKLECIHDEGHHALLLQLLQEWHGVVILIVRDSLIQQVVEKYKIEQPLVILKEQLQSVHVSNDLDMYSANVGAMANVLRNSITNGNPAYSPIALCNVLFMAAAATERVEPGRLDARVQEYYDQIDRIMQSRDAQTSSAIDAKAISASSRSDFLAEGDDSDDPEDLEEALWMSRLAGEASFTAKKPRK